MPPRERVRYTSKEPSAFRADFFGALFGCFEPPPPFEVQGDTAIVSITGPLEHHEGWWFDSYDAIAARFAAALESPCSSVLLRIDSPGGMVSGCFELARSMRAKAAAAGKRLTAYVDGMCCSGGYAIACSASAIYAPPTATIGSIGVMLGFVDVTGQDGMFGEKWTLFTSGDRKADGNPHQTISPEAATRAQEQVDELAEMFFALVSEARGLTPDAVRDLKADIFFGARSKSLGLIDDVRTLDDALALASGAASTEEDMGWKDAMKEAAKEGDEEAKKCLSALEDGDPAEGDEEGKDKDGKDGKATKDGGADEDGKGADARSSKPRTVAQRLADLEAQEEKRSLLASRPDLPSAQRADLLGQPLSVVRYAVKSFPKVVRASAATPPAASTVPPVSLPGAHAAASTPGATQGGQSNAKTAHVESDDPALDAAIDKAMGVNRIKVHGVVQKGNVVQFGHLSPEAAARRVVELETAEAAEAQKGAAE
jgi:signal peptide peptidase SppA